MQMAAETIQTDAPAKTSRRDPTIDGLKLVAAGAIVMVHIAMQPSAGPLPNFVEQVSYSALYFFFMVAGYFHGALGTRGITWLRKRLVRLAVPYYAWSLIFVVWWTIYHFIKHWPQPWYFPDPIRFLFFAGAAEILWSLPWLFACALAAELFARTPAMRRALLVVALIVQLCVYAFLPQAWIPNYAIRQFIAGARWVFMYVAGMELRAAEHPKGTPFGWTALAIGAAIAAGTVAIFTGPQPTTLVPEIVLFVLNGTVALSLLAGSRVNAKWFGARRLAWGGDYLLGIYVSHGLWLAIVRRIYPNHIVHAWLWLIVGWAIVFGISVAVTHALLGNRWTRMIVT